MASLRTSHLDRRFTIMLIWERRQLEEAIKSNNEAKAMQQKMKVHLLKDLVSMRRLFKEKQCFDDASTRKFLREQLECLRILNAEMSGGGGGEQLLMSRREEHRSGLESFRSMKEEIEAIEREAGDGDINLIVEKMQGLLSDARE